MSFTQNPLTMILKEIIINRSKYFDFESNVDLTINSLEDVERVLDYANGGNADATVAYADFLTGNSYDLLFDHTNINDIEDEEEAIKWYKKATDLGNVKAILNWEKFMKRMIISN